MTLAAIFLTKNDFFKKSTVLNLGGKYIYEFEEFANGSFGIRRILNEKYIKNFFDSSEVLLNISAVVGANGVGKTSIMKEITSTVTNKRTSNLLIYEKGDKIILHPKQSIVKLDDTDEFEIGSDIIDISTIYYSPFLDFKAEFNGIDLSFDSILKKDLQSIPELALPGGIIFPSDILKQANYKRYRNLKVSELAKPIKEIFDFPDDNLHRVTFTRYKIDADGHKVTFHNTPRDFQPFLQVLFQKIRDEAGIIRNFKRDSQEDIFILQKNLLKNYILMDFFCLLVKLMEVNNSYLEEGHFKTVDIFKLGSIYNKYNAFGFFKLWLSDYFYSKADDKNLPDVEVLNLMNFLFEYIDNIEYLKERKGSIYFNWNLKSIFFETEKLDELYKLERTLIVSLSKYYAYNDMKGNLVYDTVSQIPKYINLEPSFRNLSSGETAMLNLFSRIHEYFDINVISNVPTDKKYANYLLLLDEADLGFHPIWKRHFVKTLIEFLTKLFKKIDSKVQIIFTTHDPLALSDLPSNNIVYMSKLSNDSSSSIISNSNSLKPKHSFGANLTDLLADSFFLKDSLMGDFAKDKIQQTIDWLNKEERNIEEKDYHKQLINMVDEPILQTKLESMYYNLFKDEIDLEEKKQHLSNLAEQYGLDINIK